jgi:hypothetical protein
MKRVTLLSALIIPLIVAAGFIVKGRSSSKNPSITFYETPLVCNAAPEIGCGSRAKPALLELEKNPAVKEVWLNRPGTVIAIVWKDKAKTENVVKPILDENNISFTELKESEIASYKQTFRKSNLWYRGADVDKLSLEEASTIAQSAIKPALDNKLITSVEAEKIRSEIEAYFRKELVQIRTNEQLNDDSENKWKVAMVEIAEKYIGKERTEKAMQLYLENCEKQCKKDASCNQPGAKKDCCNKDK